MYEIVEAKDGYKIIRNKREFLVKHLDGKTWWSEDPTNAKVYKAHRSARRAIEAMKER